MNELDIPNTPAQASLRDRFVGLTRMRIVRDLLMTFGGRWVQILLGLVGSVLSARALGPAEFGRFGLVIAVIMVFGTVADAGLTYSAIRLVARHSVNNNAEGHAVARGYFSLRLASGASVAVLGFLLSWPLAWLLGYPDLVPYLQLSFLTLVSLSISSYPNMILIGLAKFKEAGVAGILNAIITVAGILLLFVAGVLSLGTLIAWNVILPLVSTFPAWFFIPREWLPWRLWRNREATRDTEVRRELIGFGKWIGLSLAGSILVAQADVLLLGRFSTPAVVGVYSVALTLASRLDSVNQSLFTVLMPRASRVEGAAGLHKYWRQVGFLSLVLAAVLGAAAVVIQPAIVFLYGERYLASAGLFFALMVVVLFDLATSSLFLLVFPLNKPKLLAAADWLRVAVMAIFGSALIPLYGAIGAVIARLLARVTGTALTLRGLRQAIASIEQVSDEPTDVASG